MVDVTNDDAKKAAAAAAEKADNVKLASMAKTFTIWGVRIQDPSFPEIGEVVCFNADEAKKVMATITDILSARVQS